MSYRCQECGKIVFPNEKHTLYDCGEHHLFRAIDIYRKMLTHLELEKIEPSQKTPVERNR